MNRARRGGGRGDGPPREGRDRGRDRPRRDGPPKPPRPEGVGDKAADEILSGHGRRVADEAEKIAARMQRVPAEHLRALIGAFARVRLADVEPAERLSQLHMLRPTLAYLAGRPDGRGLGELKASFDRLSGRARPNQVSAVLDFAEAVVLYQLGRPGGSR